ncbi:MAG: hypothetical protein SNJ59_13875 [Aggregatilineales bacterium]
MFRRVDQSTILARFLEAVSARLARQRGLPVVIGVVLIAISFAIQLLNLAAPTPFLDLLWALTHHIGLLVALIGLLLIEPLGR